MNIQKKDRKFQYTYKDRGDMTLKLREIQPVPGDRGDLNRHKRSPKETLFKSKSEKVDIVLVSRSTNTLTESLPSFAYRAKKEDGRVDFWKRIKDRYTFKRLQKVDTEVIKNKFNQAIQRDVKKETPKVSNSESSKKLNSNEFAKKTARTKDKIPIHRAVSTMKMKSKNADGTPERAQDSMEKVKNCHKEKLRPVIQTITSKKDSMRVYKAVKFVENVQRKQLRIKIPKHRPSSKSKIPVSISKHTYDTREPCAKRLRSERQKLQRNPPSKTSCSPEEIAQWVPESITQHTKPYYEAWVSKTATASTKCSEEEKRKILEIRKPLPVHNFAEEDAGRIRVRRKN